MMGDEYTISQYLGAEFQLKILWQLVSEPEFAEKSIPLLEISYFDDATFKRFFSIIQQYFELNGKPPNLQNKSILHAIRKFSKKNDPIEIDLLDAVAIQLNNWNERVLNKELQHDGDTIQKETLNFIKQQEYRKIASYIQGEVKQGNNSDEFLFNVENDLKKIGEIGDEDDMGIEIMDNISRALTKEFRKPIPTGIKGIDTLTNGGLGGGEIGIILAPSGVGKSTILTYIANTAYNLGLNVLQIIFEDKEDDIRRKHFAKWSKIPLSEMDDNLVKVNDKIIDWHKENIFGKLIIKKFSQEDTTMPKVRQYVNRYKKKFGLSFDIIILDYLDVLEPHTRGLDQNAGELQIVKSFEGMAHELDIPCWTALQTNRSGFGSELVDTGQMGGNIKRAQKTHFLMSVAKTQEQKLIGQANIAILKARMASDGHVFKDCIFNNDTMEIALTDPVNDPTRINLPTITEEKIDNLNQEISERYKARSENEADEINNSNENIEHIKPIAIENGKEILKNLHEGEDIGDKSKTDLTEILRQQRESQNVMKNN